MAKITLTDITAGYDTATISAANNTLIEDAIENTLSRDGTSPNQMESGLDMNSYRITNLPTAANSSEPVTLGQAASILDTTTATRENLGSTIWPTTSAETSAAVTPTNYYYEPGDVRRYGALVDGSTDDSAAWASAESQAGSGAPIFVPSTGSGMAIASGVSTVNDVEFEPGAFLLYTGSADEAALTLGTTGSSLRKNFKNLSVHRDSQSDWSDEACIGILALNLSGSRVEVFNVDGFTIGLKAFGDGRGCAYNQFFITRIFNNKVAINLDSDQAGGYCNENTFWGGQIGNNSGTNINSDRWGIRLDATDTSNPPNSNYFLKQSLEIIDSAVHGGTGVARPILINYGYWNRFDELRDEGNDTPFMECENNSQWNVAKTTTSVTSVVRNDGDLDNNFVFNYQRDAYRAQNPSWNSPALHRVANEYNGAGSVYIPGCSIKRSADVADVHRIQDVSITVDDEYIDIAGTRAVGVMVETENLKRFVFRRDVVSGRGGRIVIVPYDTNAAQLTTDGGYVRGSVSHTTDWGGAYRTGADSDNDLFFSVTDDVYFVWIGYAGGTASARVKSFQIESLDGGSLTVFQGYTDVNSDPFPNDMQNYAIAVPATATAGPNYPAGKRLTKFNAAAGAEPGWICTTQGLGGTAVFKAEANVAA